MTMIFLNVKMSWERLLKRGFHKLSTYKNVNIANFILAVLSEIN